MRIINPAEFQSQYCTRDDITYIYSSEIQKEREDKDFVIFHGRFNKVHVCLNPSFIYFISSSDPGNQVCFYGVYEIRINKQYMEIRCRRNDICTKYRLEMIEEKLL